MIKRRLPKIISLFLLLFFIVSFSCIDSFASQEEDLWEIRGSYITVEKYEVSGGSIIPGNDFALTLLIKNNSPRDVARNVMVDISNPEGVAPVYGTTSQRFVGDMSPGAEKEITIDYNSFTEISTKTLEFNVTILSDTRTNYVVLRVPSGTDAPFVILTDNFPTTGKTLEYVNFKTTFKVLGQENVSDVEYVVMVDGEEKVNNRIGIMSPGSSKTQVGSYAFYQPGEYNVGTLLRYSEKDGTVSEMAISNGVIKITENDMKTNTENDLNTNPEAVDHRTLVMVLSGVLILLIIVVAAVAVKKNR
ncbi:MAG: hypothetical protein K6F84_04105 [Lachnospiraceae bacterium]|nr:hypothetical protein [Lachnospiraceae bacterium]